MKDIDRFPDPSRRSGGHLGTPQPAGGRGGRGTRKPFGRPKHFGHGKSTAQNAGTNPPAEAGDAPSGFGSGGGRISVPLPLKQPHEHNKRARGQPAGKRRKRKKTRRKKGQTTHTMPQGRPAKRPPLDMQDLGPLDIQAWPVYLPPYSAFRVNTCDIYTGNQFPPAAGDKRTAYQPMLITGVWPEGHRQKIVTTDAYTHVIICDPTIEFRDLYAGQGQSPNATPDYLAIPANQTNNFWRVVFQMVANLPGFGRQRFIFVDRWRAPGSYTGID